MHTRILHLLLPALIGFAGLSLLPAQTPPLAQPHNPIQPTGLNTPAPASTVTTSGPVRDVEKMSPLQRQMYVGGQRGAEWLHLMNSMDGRFRPGLYTAVRMEMDQDNCLRQVGAAFALARAARVTGDKRYAARAMQALLVLLDETATDRNDPQCRCTTAPALVVNKLGAAGMLVMAINELPAPPADLLEKSEQLCNFLKKQLRNDGSICTSEAGDDGKPLPESPESVDLYPGMALYGLALSQRHRPAPWKADSLKKAVAYYHPAWRARKSMTMVPYHSAAYAEAYQATKDTAYADAVTEMNDWLLTLQYDLGSDNRRQMWYGGFKGWQDGKPVETMPTALGGVYAESLVSACRTAKQAGDLKRFDRYNEATVRALHFLAILQYTDANSQHFADGYRKWILGGVHGSQNDGNLRLDYNQYAVSAMLLYVEHVGEAAR